MEMEIDRQLIEEYNQNGAVCLRGVFDKHWIDVAIKGIEKTLASPSEFSESLKGSKSEACYFDDYFNWRRIQELQDYAFQSPAAAIVGQLMKSEMVAFYHEHVLVKEPGTDRETPWHQDQSYYPIDGDKVCSIWMPVDPVPKETCVQFVAGSHKWGKWYQPVKFATTLPYETVKEDNTKRIYHPIPDVDANRNRWKILSWDLQLGDCIVFHMKTLHGAPGNSSTVLPRRILSTRWLGDDAVISTRPWEPSPPVLGNLKPGDRAASAEFPVVQLDCSL